MHEIAISLDVATGIFESALEVQSSIASGDKVDFPQKASGIHREIGAFTITRDGTNCVLVSDIPLPPGEEPDGAYFLEEGVA